MISDATITKAAKALRKYVRWTNEDGTRRIDPFEPWYKMSNSRKEKYRECVRIVLREAGVNR
jgi:hypothetical protein